MRASHLEEGASDWSPWSKRLLVSTSVPFYSWDSSNDGWLVSDNLAKQVTESLTPLFSSSAQFFPGCRLNLTVKESPSAASIDSGFALVQQWVQGGSLCQQGTVFVSVSGQLFVDGKLDSEPFAAFDRGCSLNVDCDPHPDTIDETSLRLRLTLSSREQEHSLHWTLRSHVSNVYFGVQFGHRGTLVKID